MDESNSLGNGQPKPRIAGFELGLSRRVERRFASLEELCEDPFVLSGRDPNPGLLSRNIPFRCCWTLLTRAAMDADLVSVQRTGMALVTRRLKNLSTQPGPAWIAGHGSPVSVIRCAYF
jgi:hypothetical protein